LSNSIFSREEQHTVRSDARTIVVKQPPEDGRPAAYAGAVGDLSLNARVDAARGRVGDPLMLSLAVSGVGNVHFFPRPSLAIPWASVVAAGERVVIDSASTLVSGQKVFDWVLTPRHAGQVSVPQIRYPYFNPYTERYEIAITAPQRVTVDPGTLLARDSTSDTPDAALPLRREFRGPLREPVSSRSTFWFLLAAAPLPALAVAGRRRPRASVRRSAAQALREVVPGRAIDPAALRRTFARAVAERVHVSASVMADHTAFVRTLRRSGVTVETARAADRLLAELDAAVFGPNGALPDNAATRARIVFDAVDDEARSAHALANDPMRSRLLSLVAFLATFAMSASLASASVTQNSRAAFEAGVQAYDDERFADAKRIFGEIAEAEPRAADAWANAGTAAWQLEDTASAVIGWQAALRLEPLARDLRERLVFTPGFENGLVGDVPPLSIDAIAITAAALWFLAWLALAYAQVKHSEPARTAWRGALLAAGVLGLVGVGLASMLSGRRATVVVHAERLRNAPALGADAAEEVVTGEVARVTGVQGAWTRLRLRDGRSGWMEGHRLVSLESPHFPTP
jgi:hypothetical protein